MRTCTHGALARVAVLAAVFVQSALAHEFYDGGGLQVQGSLLARSGIRYGSGINFGAGALTGFGRYFNPTGEEERVDLEFGLRPRLTLDYTAGAVTLHGGVSMVAATITADGELSGQFGRGGDEAIDTDEAYVGVRAGMFDLTVGGQVFSIGDGLIIGDGNFNEGGSDGQYWLGMYSAWRNSAVLKINTAPVRADLYWLRTDDMLGDARVAGLSVENADATRWGRAGFMYFRIYDDDTRVGLDGMDVAGVRGEDLHLPALPQLRVWAEYLVQRGNSTLTGIDNHATAWYLEGQLRGESQPWTPQLSYRYARFSGDRAGSRDSEEFRALFFTLGKRDWDSWYMGEITGEFHLFNQNQVTQIAKLRVFPRPGWTLGGSWLDNTLEEPQYFGIPVTDTDWSEELNLWVEHTPTDALYLRALLAWARPGTAARQIFGGKDQLVTGLFVQYSFK